MAQVRLANTKLKK